ncbi:activator of HSP90 ATPase [Sphaerisporangium melleum]|uniref:Activator of HSP90 ATPase n=1 Tax=Sphaerisporangium melleum TaxID=321316 RepID=A0A917VKK1_9ACTN|nr:SRPBCC domain-containing protein [Sphaerisporangium melleum]GGK94381.1 activator of HSP90 ATPase [Sphaerisporangium melleum]GII73238.1 activator of HSP90 ATPase [Sphaerisporangium melleum]
MTVVSTDKDLDARTLTFVSEFDAGVERVWQVWEDARQTERWWGPPMWPATFEQHDFTVGGGSRYRMNGPGEQEVRGWWRFTAIEAPARLEFDDGFGGDENDPLVAMDPAHIVVTIEPHGAGSRMTLATVYTSAEQLDQILAMGVIEGMSAALGQIDGVLAAAPN